MKRTACTAAIATLLVVFLCSSGAAAGPDEAVAALFSADVDDVLSIDGKMLPHPALTAVIALRDEAIPRLIGVLRNEEASDDEASVAEAALLAIVSGAPLDRIRPRKLDANDKKAWLDWWRAGSPVRVTLEGVRTPRGIDPELIRPPEGWPLDAEEVELPPEIAAIFARPRPSKAAMETIARLGDAAARRDLLLLLSEWGDRYGISAAIAAVGEPSDALYLARLAPTAPDERGAWLDLEKAMAKLASRDARVAHLLLESESPAVRAAGVQALVRDGTTHPAELTGILSGAGPYARRRAYEEIGKEPERWAPLLLARLDDRVADLSGPLRLALEAGALDREAARARLEDLHESPHAYVRIRAAEAMLGVSKETGARWLEEELRIHKTWSRGFGVSCTGVRSGLRGRVDRLLSPGPPPSPYTTTGDPVVLPADTFDVEVIPIPYQGRPTFEVWLRNATGEVFERYPYYSSGRVEHWREGSASAGGHYGDSFGSHANLLRCEPGEVVFTKTLSYSLEETGNLESVEVSVRFTIPGARRAKYAIEIDGSKFAAFDELSAFQSGLASEDEHVRLKFAWILAKDDGTEWTPPDLPKVIDALIRAVADGVPDEGEFRFFVRTYGVPNATQAALQSLKNFLDGMTADAFGRILRLADPVATRLTRRWSIPDRLVPVIRDALAKDDAVLIRNLALGPATKLREVRADLDRAVGRWLESGDPLILRAGLFAAAKIKKDVDAAAVEAALDRALSSEDPAVVRTAVLASEAVAERPDPRLYAVFLKSENDAVRAAVLEVLERGTRNGRTLPEGVRAIFDATVDRIDDISPDMRIALMRLLRQERAAAPVAYLEAAYERSRSNWIHDVLVDRGHVFGSPVLERIDGNPLLTDLIGKPDWNVTSREIARMEMAPPPAFGDLYTEILTEALRVGNARLAAASCIPLALAEDGASLHALESALSSDDAEVHLRAAWCVYLRDPGKGLPHLEAVAGDPRARMRNGREVIRIQRDLIEKHCPELRDPVRPLPPVFSLAR